MQTIYSLLVTLQSGLLFWLTFDHFWQHFLVSCENWLVLKTSPTCQGKSIAIPGSLCRMWHLKLQVLQAYNFTRFLIFVLHRIFPTNRVLRWKNVWHYKNKQIRFFKKHFRWSFFVQINVSNSHIIRKMTMWHNTGANLIR